MSMTDGGGSDRNRSILAFLMNLFRGGPGGPSAQDFGGFPPAPGSPEAAGFGFPQAPGGPMTDMSVAGPWGAGQPGLSGPESAPTPQPRPEQAPVVPKSRIEQLHEDRWNNRRGGMGGF